MTAIEVNISIGAATFARQLIFSNKNVTSLFFSNCESEIVYVTTISSNGDFTDNAI